MCGLGELHLEIIDHRLHELIPGKSFYLGPVLVSYRYCIQENAINERNVLEHSSSFLINGKKEQCTICFRISSKPGNSMTSESLGGAYPLGQFSHEHNSFVNRVLKDVDVSNGIQDGVLSALFDGKIGISVVNVIVELLSFRCSTASSTLSFMAARAAIQHYLLNRVELTLLEPVMRTEITVDKEFSSAVISELIHSRRGTIEMVQAIDGRKRIESTVPLKNMLHYSSALRSIASGNCSFTMEFIGYDVAPKTLV